jgi:hypothetical protein
MSDERKQDRGERDREKEREVIGREGEGGRESGRGRERGIGREGQIDWEREREG